MTHPNKSLSEISPGHSIKRKKRNYLFKRGLVLNQQLWAIGSILLGWDAVFDVGLLQTLKGVDHSEQFSLIIILLTLSGIPIQFDFFHEFWSRCSSGSHHLPIARPVFQCLLGFSSLSLFFILCLRDLERQINQNDHFCSLSVMFWFPMFFSNYFFMQQQKVSWCNSYKRSWLKFGKITLLYYQPFFITGKSGRSSSTSIVERYFFLFLSLDDKILAPNVFPRLSESRRTFFSGRSFPHTNLKKPNGKELAKKDILYYIARPNDFPWHAPTSSEVC